MKVISIFPSLEEVIRSCIVQNLNANDLDIEKTAKVLGLDKRTLKRRLKEHNIEFKEKQIAY